MRLTILPLLTALVLTSSTYADETNSAAVDIDQPPMEFKLTPDDSGCVLNLGMLQDDDEPEPTTRTFTDVRVRYGAEDTKRFYLHGGGGTAIKGGNDGMGVLGLGFEYFMADDLSVNLELNVAFFSQEIEDAWGGNLALLFRWHFINEGNWTMYVDGGAGLLYTSSDVPDHGSSFNFTPQAGIGFTYDIGHNNRLMFGGRWHHVSNANIYDENPGLDSIMVYAGINMPF